MNSNFTFLNADVRIAPNVQIRVANGASFTLDNSKLFSCNDLWEGIILSDGATFTSKNNTLIEDAKTAVKSVNTAYVILDISQTTFNRNRTGIWLESTPNPIHPPTFVQFSSNVFSCTSPINGTTGSITDQGIYSKNVPLFTYSVPVLTYSRFEGIRDGIRVEGDPTILKANSMIFRNIQHNGIFMQSGDLEVNTCHFLNFGETGINITDPRRIKVNNASFVINQTDGQFITGNTRSGILLAEPFNVNPGYEIIITNSLFSQNTLSDPGTFTGINFFGISAPRTFSVHDNEFIIKGQLGTGISLFNAFTSISHYDIFNNTFTLRAATYLPGGLSFDVTGIRANGKFDNLQVTDNHFVGENPDPLSFDEGLNFLGVDGLGNEISRNYLDPNDFPNLSLETGALIQDCPGLFISSNIDYWASARYFYFIGTNTKTTFRANQVFGAGHDIQPGAIIGTQDQMGNLWQDSPSYIAPCIFDPNLLCNYRYLPYVRCIGGDCGNSKFIVHTPQSILNTVTNAYTYFSAYYPYYTLCGTDLTDFCTSGDFFEIQFGQQPAGPCLDQAPPGIADELDEKVAMGLFSPPADNPSQLWIMQRYLYRQLSEIPGFGQGNANLSAFASAQANTHIGRFYDIEKGMLDAYAADSAVSAQMSQQKQILLQYEQAIAVTDHLLYTTTDPQTLQSLRQTKASQLADWQAARQSLTLLEFTYRSAVKGSFQSAQGKNNAVPVSNDRETNQKSVNGIYLAAVLQQNGELSNTQLADLQTLAYLCPKQAGPAVYQAAALLRSCHNPGLDFFNACGETRYPPQVLKVRQESHDRQADTIPPIDMLSLRLYPQPAEHMVTVELGQAINGSIIIQDVLGRIVGKRNISGESAIGFALSLPQGLYFLSCVEAGGQRLAAKPLLIQY